MYCVIQKIMLKKRNPFGEHKEIIPYPLEMSINGVEQTPVWCWKWSEERFERPHLEAYKISLHQSYRENGAVKKKQFSVCTMSYYDICGDFGWWGDCIIGGENALAEKLGMETDELYNLIDGKLEPLRKRLEEEFHQSPEYAAKQRHRSILEAHDKARSAFAKRYSVDVDEYDRCYDVFGELRNAAYLEKIKAERKAKRSYQESRRSTYGGGTSGSYSVPPVSTYTEDETAILRGFYRSLSKTYHPDLNPGKDTTAEMQMLNRLKELWGV